VQGVPELQLGLFNDTATDRHPFISFNTYWNPLTNTWETSKANTTGFVLFDPYAEGTLYLVGTGNSSVSGNQSTGFATDIMRWQRTLVTSFLPLQVGYDSIPHEVVNGTGGESGIRIVYNGDTAVDLPRLTMYMTYFNGLPRFQITQFDIGQVFQLTEGYLDTNGQVRFFLSPWVGDVCVCLLAPSHPPSHTPMVKDPCVYRAI
jgi:hypothetical protein